MQLRKSSEQKQIKSLNKKSHRNDDGAVGVLRDPPRFVIEYVS